MKDAFTDRVQTAQNLAKIFGLYKCISFQVRKNARISDSFRFLKHPKTESPTANQGRSFHLGGQQKKTLTFHYTGCLIGILIMVYYI